jgi:hypothetical protein
VPDFFATTCGSVANNSGVRCTISRLFGGLRSELFAKPMRIPGNRQTIRARGSQVRVASALSDETAVANNSRRCGADDVDGNSGRIGDLAMRTFSSDMSLVAIE